jgi:pSer/pThr/pTyr-binding forkhead associated (FHA) protein
LPQKLRQPSRLNIGAGLSHLPATAVKLKLVSQDPLAPVREISITCLPVELGRGETAAVRIEDRWLSRRHCRIDDVAGSLVVRDLGSRHGTYVNGQAITECPLQPGDELCIGLSHFVAEYEADEPVPTTAAVVQLTPVLA